MEATLIVKRRSPMQWKMKKILALLLALVGFAAVSCDHRCYYGTPEDTFEEKSAVCDDICTNANEDIAINAAVSENTSEK